MEAGRLLNDRYLLVERLGEGGMSVVWRARDRVLGREVAVKVLGARFAADADWRRRIRREARAAARLSHPNITGVYDYGETDGHAPFVVMELLRGPTLAERLSAGSLPAEAALRIGAEVAAGLAAAHAEDLVHRDVKPANVVLTPDAAKVLDFGIVGFAGVPEEADAAEQVLGTPAYLAPERLISDEVTPASDVYAFGVLLYRCLTGALPWTTESTTQLVTAHVVVPPEPLPDLPGVPPDVRELCMSCLAKDPAERPAAVVVAARLARAAGIVPRFSVVLQEPAPGAADQPTEVVMRAAAEPEDSRRKVLAGFGVLAVIAAVLVTFVLARPGAVAGTGRAEAGETTVPYISASADPTATAAATATAAGPSSVASTTSPPSVVPLAVSTTPPAPEATGDQGKPPAPTRGTPDTPGAPETTGPTSSVPTEGGVIVAACVGKKVAVLQVLPALGVRVVAADLGVHSNPHVEFDRAGQRLKYTLSCNGTGSPTASAG